MKTIRSGKGQETIVDDEDFEELSKYRWYVSWKRKGNSQKFYFVREDYETGERIYLHRQVLGLQRGDGNVVDHINQNTLDNRKENLRYEKGNVTNNLNRSNSTNSAQFVTHCKLQKPWRVQVKHRTKGKITLRVSEYFSTQEAANVFKLRVHNLFREMFKLGF